MYVWKATTNAKLMDTVPMITYILCMKASNQQPQGYFRACTGHDIDKSEISYDPLAIYKLHHVETPVQSH